MVRKKFLYSLLLMLTPYLLSAQQETYSFNRIKVDGELSKVEIRSIHKDLKGFMWFATDRGLIRYDSYKFQLYKFSLEDTASLSIDNVFDISEDHTGTLWISTYSGLNKFDRNKAKFSAYYIDENIKTSTNTNFILKSRIDSEGKVYSLIADKGLFVFDPEKEEFSKLTDSEGLSEIINQTDISSFLISKNGSVWFSRTDGTEGLGLYNYDPLTKKIISYLPDQAHGLTRHGIFNILEDKKGNIWIGLSNGLKKLDSKTGIFTHYDSDEHNFRSMPQGRIDALEEDEEGIIWDGTNGKGLVRLNPSTEEIKVFRNDPSDKNSLNSNTIRSILCDKNGLLWIGTDKGLHQLNLKHRNFENFLYSQEDEISTSNQISYLYTDQYNVFWYCTEKGLYKYDGKTPPELILPVSWKELVQDKSGKFWIIGSKLLSFDPKSKEFKNYPSDPDDPNKLNSDHLWSLYIDQEEMIWVGTGGGGLNGLDLKTGKTVYYLHDPNNENSISTNG